MAQPGDYGLYIPSTFLMDVQNLQDLDVNSAQFKELLVRLYQNLNTMCIALNLKDSAYYNTQEFVNGQMWFPNPAYNSSTVVNATYRNVFRTVVNFGPLPNAGVISMPHHIPINAGYTFTRIYGAASDTTDLLYIPIPYVSVSISGVEIDITATDVVITTAHDYSNYNVCYVVLEYIKN